MTKLIKTVYQIKNLDTRTGKEGGPIYILLKKKKEVEELFEKGSRVYAVKTVGGVSYRYLFKTHEEIQEAYAEGLLCGVKMPWYKLLDEEYNVLNLLATRSGMDCWFWLVERGGKDMVRDLEADKYTVMPLSKALPIFVEGLLELDCYHLSEEEKEVVHQLFDRFGIDFKPV